MLIVCKHILLTDAKMLKDIPQHLIRRNFPYDVAQVEGALAEILGDEVAGEVGGEAFSHTADGFESAGEGFVVAEVRDDDVVGGEGGQMGSLDQEGAQALQALLALGGEGYDPGAFGEGKDSYGGGGGGQVALVEDEDELFAFA